MRVCHDETDDVLFLTGFVGTVFINAISNLRSVFGMCARLHITSNHEVMTYTHTKNSLTQTRTSDTITTELRLFPLRYGADLDIVLNRSLIEDASTTITLMFKVTGGHEVSLEVTPLEMGMGMANHHHHQEFHIARAEFCQSVYECLNQSYSPEFVGRFTPSPRLQDARYSCQSNDGPS